MILRVKIIVMCFMLFLVSTSIAQEDIYSMVRNRVEVEKVEMFLDKYPDTLNQPTKEGYTALILAAYTGNHELVELFIKRGVEVNHVSKMGTALMASIVNGNIEIAELLLKNKASLDLTDDNGITALMYAVQFKISSLVELLLQYNPDKNKMDNTGKTAFEYAILSGNQEIIKLLK
ncbi:MAG: ankyrin repeat domain-containing protein [Flavobacterium sp.]